MLLMFPFMFNVIPHESTVTENILQPLIDCANVIFFYFIRWN